MLISDLIRGASRWHAQYCLLLVSLCLPPLTHAQQTTPDPVVIPAVDLQTDTWIATDALGHTLVTSAQARLARKDRFVGIFYFLTHGSSREYYSPEVLADPRKRFVYGDHGDNTEIIRRIGGSPITEPGG